MATSEKAINKQDLFPDTNWLCRNMMIETERLYIRSFCKHDKRDYVAIATDPDVRKYIRNGKPLTPEKAEQWVIDNMHTEKVRGYARYAVILKSCCALN